MPDILENCYQTMEEAAGTFLQVHLDHDRILQPKAELVLVRRLIGEIEYKG